MKQNLAELVFILDRSGSMQGLEVDTIGGFNAMLEKQKKEPGKILTKEDVAAKMFPCVTAAKAVILVHVLFRQNSSMQGRLQCSYTGARYIAFRSALELMRMLDEANTYMCRNRKNKDLKM